eukprot:TRINITY_DN8168_c0_g1_i1.p1 TRINITY_DN8168_c0_g1~~TRINITY_DN8168_c0_g1_i1.p1  ORF type:complete len:902 (+),score=180.65 TRINITY_DN8168_c0_g1_i1:51-2756(+)
MKASATPLCFALVVLFAACVVRSEYHLTSLTETLNGFEGVLTYHGSDSRAISPLALKVSYRTKDTLHFKITDPNEKRWEVVDVVQLDDPETPPPSLDYKVEFVNAPFQMIVKRAGDSGEVIYQTTPLVFRDQYLELGTTTVSDPFIYGLGERIHKLRLTLGRHYTLFNSDQMTPRDNPIYGSHPFYMELRETGAFGVFLLNSNAMDVFVGDASDPKVVFKTIGGVLDFYIFLGPTPESVSKQYHRVIGFPTLHPYWIYGYHQCRYGYPDLQTVEEVVRKFNELQLPMDAMWMDIDYMDKFKIHTNDEVNFPLARFSAFSHELNHMNKRLFLIVDPGVGYTHGYDYFEKGNAEGIFIRDPEDDSKPYVGKVWPGPCVFPDFSNPKTETYWTDILREFRSKILVDGLWIDMNEIASFCDGRCKMNIEYEKLETSDLFTCDCTEQYAPSKYNDPEYFPGGPEARVHRAVTDAKLDRSTIHMEAKHYLGIEYDLHNLYGHFEARATKRAYEGLTNQRSAIITRASFAGTGRYAGHWLGDNWSNYQNMRDSITGVINFNMFGIPMVGADVCGFLEKTNEELCARWMQLGVFYTFYRNHNAKGEPSQEPYVFSEKTTDISRKALQLRYRLIPYYYTLLYHIHMEGGTALRSLFMNYPKDKNTWEIDTQLMVGSALLVSPVLEAGVTQVNAYFPGGTQWFDWFTGKPMPFSADGQYHLLDAPIDVLPVHMAAGHIIPLQQHALNTVEARRTPFTLVVALKSSSQSSEVLASGSLYVDDGISVEPRRTGYGLVEYSAVSDEIGGFLLTNQVKGTYGEFQYEGIEVYGVQCLVSRVTRHGERIPFVTEGHKLRIPIPGVGLYDGLGVRVECADEGLGLKQPRGLVTIIITSLALTLTLLYLRERNMASRK